jgi:hypothetical protein
MPLGATIRGPDTTAAAPGEVGLRAASIKSVGTDAMPVPLGVGFRVPLGFYGSPG